MNSTKKHLRKFMQNPMNLLLPSLGIIGEMLIQTRIISNIAQTFLMGMIILLTMLFVLPNISWKKPYFTLPWKQIEA